jgi:hypothetical protein
VEGDVVLAHELVKFYVVGWVEPPLFPLIIVVGSDRDVADWRVEPNIKNFVTVFL